jgi:AraC-like DNA-binding protein
VEGEEPARLESGDILLLPHGDAYAISDQPRAPSDTDIEPARQFFSLMAAGELPLIIEDGGGGPQQNQLVCGFLGCDRRPFNPLLDGLPRYIVLSRTALDAPINDLIDIVLRECRQPHAGSRCMMLRLGELLFIEVLRQYLHKDSDKNNAWMRGIADPLVVKSLSLLHGRIAETWTLEKLAGELGCSRSTFAEHFHRVMGVPPMQYLSDWRLQVAARLLRDRQDKILSIALGVGYDSEAAFSRAFKRVVGLSPSVFRRSDQAVKKDVES